jgi:putative ABC transport system permease protein
MSVRELWIRLTIPFRRGRMDRELREELALHLSLRAEQIGRDGLASDDAALAARRQFGNVARITEASRSAWGWQWLDGVRQDLRYVVRQLVHHPGFAVVVVLTIALGVALNTAAFSFYDAVVLKPLPVRDPSELVRVMQDQRLPAREVLPYAAYDIVRRDARSVRSVIATSGPVPVRVRLPGHVAGDERVLDARLVSNDYFAALGLRLALGHAFDSPNERAVILSHQLWRTALNADPGVIGKSIMLGGEDFVVAGIAPPSFAGTGEPPIAPDLWAPMMLQAVIAPGSDWTRDARPHWQVLARLSPDVSITQSRAEIAAMSRAVPDTLGKPTPIGLTRATYFQTDSGEFEVFQQVSAALMAALALILGIATVNLVNLVAARNAARSREVAVRLALGSARARIARQFATESLVLSTIGGALGLAGAWWFAGWMRVWVTGAIARVTGGSLTLSFDVSVDWRIVAYAAATSAVVGLVAGIWPAVGASRTDANMLLKQGTTSTAGRTARSGRHVLLSTQIAGCLVLLTAAGTLLGGLRRGRVVDTGLDADHLLVVSFAAGLGQAEQRALPEAARRLAELPEVRTVAWSQRVPFGGTQTRATMTRTGLVSVTIHRGDGALFDALGIPLLAGRTFTPSEVERGAPVAIVSRKLAETAWPGENPIGKVIAPGRLLSGPDTTKSYSVIGVVGDARTNFLSRPDPGAEYFPYSSERSGAFLVRTRGAPSLAARPVRVALSAVSPTLTAQATVVPLEDGPVALQRLMAQAPAAVAMMLALVGLALSSVGVYGLVAQIVARRTREIGVYMALGATGREVVALILRQTLRPVAWGTVAGAVGAVGVSLVLRSVIAMPDAPDLTFGAGAFDPMVFLGVIAVLGVVVVAACAVPARRAAGVDPAEALRTD